MGGVRSRRNPRERKVRVQGEQCALPSLCFSSLVPHSGKFEPSSRIHGLLYFWWVYKIALCSLASEVCIRLPRFTRNYHRVVTDINAIRPWGDYRSGRMSEGRRQPERDGAAGSCLTVHSSESSDSTAGDVTSGIVDTADFTEWWFVYRCASLDTVPYDTACLFDSQRERRFGIASGIFEHHEAGGSDEKPLHPFDAQDMSCCSSVYCRIEPDASNLHWLWWGREARGTEIHELYSLDQGRNGGKKSKGWQLLL